MQIIRSLLLSFALQQAVKASSELKSILDGLHFRSLASVSAKHNLIGHHKKVDFHTAGFRHNLKTFSSVRPKSWRRTYEEIRTSSRSSAQYELGSACS